MVVAGMKQNIYIPKQSQAYWWGKKRKKEKKEKEKEKKKNCMQNNSNNHITGEIWGLLNVSIRMGWNITYATDDIILTPKLYRMRQQMRKSYLN